MRNHPKIISDPNAYGSKGQKWHPDFVAYMVSIVRHPNYEGMPDVVNAEGKIQWEAPSNRGSGVFQNTHHKRRDWWREKARTIGIDTGADQWISKTAKSIHPTKRKPCKRCGRVLRIEYAYPNARLAAKIVSVFGIELKEYEEIGHLIERLWKKFGSSVRHRLARVLSTSEIEVPPLSSLPEWLSWIEQQYIPREPALLSPGAMSNAPDRFDGFHSFNLCCRKKADTGRHDSNMKTYLTDRRVFEYWTDGDWIAADRLMALVGAQFRNHKGQDGKLESATADHVGPLSLGFSHRPEFLLLSKSANSAKNNRMRLWDVRHLIEVEASGENVVSWYAKPVWDRLKGKVDTEEAALRLSKIMRDNQRYAMLLLFEILKRGYVAFLLSLLRLEHADYDPSFQKLRIENHLTKFDSIQKTARTTKYATEQKARRVRIALNTLIDYGEKANRHGFVGLNDPEITALSGALWKTIAHETKAVEPLNERLKAQLRAALKGADEEALRALVVSVPPHLGNKFAETQASLEALMQAISEVFGSQWNSDRYLRAEFSFD